MHWKKKVFFLKCNSGQAVVAVCNGMVPNKNMYRNARVIYSQFCKAGKMVLYQVIKYKCLQDAIKTHYINISLHFEKYLFWQCLCHSICLRTFVKKKSTGKNFYRSSKGQETISSLESRSCIYDGRELMLKRA